MSRSGKKATSLYESEIWRNKNAKKSELLDYLESLHEDLSKLEQDISHAPKGLHATAAHLVSPKFMENIDRDIRIIVTCCVVDVLRIYAPEAPYKDEDMIRVFEAISKQISSLQTTNPETPAGKRILYILNNIATVKSCLVPVLLDQKGVPAANEVVESMFTAVISIVNSSSTEEVFTSACEILQSCIEEYNNISPELLEIMLVAILPAQKVENPMLYRVIATVLQTVAPIIMGTLTSIMSSILIGPGNRFQGKLSEIADDVYALIFELHLISPALMQGILPSLAAQLRCEDDATRSKVVQLLSKVYLTEGATYHDDFPQYFRDFIGRMNDALPSIRSDLIDYASILISRKVEVKYVTEMLTHRLRDPEEDVRKKAVTKLYRQVFDNVEIADPLLLTALFDRVKDKVIDIRKAAMIGMSKLYWKYVASRLPAFDSFDFSVWESIKQQVDQSMLSKLQSIPATLIKCWGYPDVETKHVTLQLLQEYILPKSFPAGSAGDNINQVRLSALLLMYSLLNDEERLFFDALLTFKCKINGLIASLINIKKGGRDSIGSSSGGSSSDHKILPMLKQVLMRLANTLPSAENKKPGFFDRLLTTRDKFVWKLLEHATETTWSIEDNAKFKDDLMKKLESKSPLAEFMALVYDVASYQLVTTPMVEVLLRSVADSAFVSHAGAPEMLSMLSRHVPKLFSESSSHLRDWVDRTTVKAEDKGKKRQVKLEYFQNGIDIITNVASHLSDAQVEDIEKLGRVLLDGMKENEDDDLVELMATGLRAVVCTQDGLSSRFLRDIVKYVKDIVNIHANGRRYLLTMRSISTLLELVPTLMDKRDSKVLCLQSLFAIFSNATRRTIVGHIQKELTNLSENPIETSVELCCASMRLLTRIVIFEDAAEETKEEEGFEFLVDLEHILDFSTMKKALFDCMESRGKGFDGFHPPAPEDEEVLYQQSCLCLMSLIATTGFSTITTEQWHELGFALLHEDSEFRALLLDELVPIIKTQQVPLRFLSYPCLVANDSHLNKTAREALSTAVARLRRTHEDVASRLVASTDDAEQLLLQQQAAETMPENALPYLLHIMTYHPEFPTSVAATSAEDKSRIKLVLGCVRMLVQALQSKLKIPTSNLPFLFKQLNTINHRFVDRMDPNNVGLHFVTRLTVKLLQEQVKTADNLHVYPGEVFLPRDLYEGVEAGKAQVQLGMIAAGGRTDVANMLDVAEFAIDQVMQVAGKGRNQKGTTMSSPAFKVRSGTGVSPERKRPSKGANRSLSFDEDNDKPEVPSKRARASKPLPEEVPSRSLPSRGAKATVKSYVEPDEMTDRDLERLDRSVADEKKRKSSDSVRERSLSPSKRQRTSEPSLFLGASLASMTTGRPSLKGAAAAAVASVSALKSSSSGESGESSEGDGMDDLFVTQTTDKTRASEPEQRRLSKTESTDGEQSASSDDVSPTLPTRSSRAANRVLVERPSNVHKKAEAGSSKTKAVAASESSEEVAVAPVRTRTQKATSSKPAVVEEEPLVKTTGKRTRQLRA